jgi:hypothetical protein
MTIEVKRRAATREERTQAAVRESRIRAVPGEQGTDTEGATEARKAAAVCHPEIIREAVRLGARNYNPQGGVVAIEAVLVDLHDLPELVEGRRDAAIIPELGREVRGLKRREPDQRGDEAVGSRLCALKGQQTAVMKDRRRIHHEVALNALVEDQHHGPPGGGEHAEVGSRGNGVDGRADEGRRVGEGGVLTEEGIGDAGGEIPVARGHPEDVVDGIRHVKLRLVVRTERGTIRVHLVTGGRVTRDMVINVVHPPAKEDRGWRQGRSGWANRGSRTRRGTTVGQQGDITDDAAASGGRGQEGGKLN